MLQMLKVGAGGTADNDVDEHKVLLVEGRSYKFVTKLSYLGAMLGSAGGLEETSATSVQMILRQVQGVCTLLSRRGVCVKQSRRAGYAGHVSKLMPRRPGH